MSSNSIETRKQVIKPCWKKERKKGILTYKEIIDALEEIEMDPSQIEKVYENIERIGIEIVGNMDEELEEIKAEEEEIDISVPEGISFDDPVRMYLKEIGKVPLFKRR